MPTRRHSQPEEGSSGHDRFNRVDPPFEALPASAQAVVARNRDDILAALRALRRSDAPPKRRRHV
jgi:hypothetical protein